MSHDEQLRSNPWERVEAAWGGRFRGGVECPEHVSDLFDLVDAQTRGGTQFPGAAFLREHIEVCPVCRRIYQSALAAAREGRPVAEPDIVSKTQLSHRELASVRDPTMATALGEATPTAPQVSPRGWNIPVRHDQATIHGAAPQNAEESALVRVHWTAKRTVEIGPTGFLLPKRGERVKVTWTSADGALLGQAELVGDKETTAEWTAPPRPPQAGDRLQLRLLDEQAATVLEVQIVIP